MKPSLTQVVRELSSVHSAESRAAPSALEAVWAENASYLVDDKRRAEVLERLRDSVGVTPESILSAKKPKLLAAIAGGGMKPELRAQKLIEAARVASLGGDLDAVAQRPIDDARRALKKLPGFGGAAVDKLLMRYGGHPVVALDSNGLRVLQRLGYGAPGKSYDQTYRSVQAELAKQLPKSVKGRVRAHELLRAHGQTLCRTNRPLCENCPLRDRCPSARP